MTSTLTSVLLFLTLAARASHSETTMRSFAPQGQVLEYLSSLTRLRGIPAGLRGTPASQRGTPASLRSTPPGLRGNRAMLRGNTAVLRGKKNRQTAAGEP